MSTETARGREGRQRREEEEREVRSRRCQEGSHVEND